MNLYELAFACYIYNSYTDFSNSLKAFLNAVSYEVDLTKPEHRKKLIVWLNKWGCRQFSLEYHNFASKQIESWYQKGHINKLPKDRKLWELSESELIDISVVFETLANKTACKRMRDGTALTISVGATGASKILFALRPEIAVPWDAYIRKALKHSGDGSSYINYLKQVIVEIESLKQSCVENNIELLDVPKIINRDSSTIPQLIGEYFWITKTKKCYPPDEVTIQHWANWSRDSSISG